MADVENVISNLELNIRWICDNPAHQFPGYGNVEMAMRDALELLKEQQAEIAQLHNDANARRCKDCKKRGQSVYRADGAEYIVCWNQGLGIQHPIDWFCADFDPSDEAVLEAFAEDE